MELLTALLLFGGSIFWTIAIGVVFLIICFASDIEKNGFYAFGSFILLIVTYYLWGDIKTFLSFFTWINITGYLGIGLLYSFLRTFIEGRKLGKRMLKLPHKKEGEHVHYTKESEKDEYIQDLKGNVFRWWFLWPISLINWILTDIIKDLWDFLYQNIRKIYNRILDIGIKTIK